MGWSVFQSTNIFKANRASPLLGGCFQADCDQLKEHAGTPASPTVAVYSCITASKDPILRADPSVQGTQQTAHRPAGPYSDIRRLTGQLRMTAFDRTIGNLTSCQELLQDRADLTHVAQHQTRAHWPQHLARSDSHAQSEASPHLSRMDSQYIHSCMCTATARARCSPFNLTMVYWGRQSANDTRAVVPSRCTQFCLFLYRKLDGLTQA